MNPNDKASIALSLMRKELTEDDFRASKPRQHTNQTQHDYKHDVSSAKSIQTSMRRDDTATTLTTNLAPHHISNIAARSSFDPNSLATPIQELSKCVSEIKDIKGAMSTREGESSILAQILKRVEILENEIRADKLSRIQQLEEDDKLHSLKVAKELRDRRYDDDLQEARARREKKLDDELADKEHRRYLDEVNARRKGNDLSDARRGIQKSLANDETILLMQAQSDMSVKEGPARTFNPHRYARYCIINFL